MNPRARRLGKQEVGVLILCGALLISSLGAVGQTGRNRAKEFVCSANVRQLSLAWLAYAQDNDGRFVGGHTGRGNSQMQWVDDPSWNAPGIEERKAAIRRGLLFPYAGDVGVYHCPVDGRPDNPTGRPFRSYSIAGGANGIGSNDYTRAQKYSEIMDPAAKYVFVEEADPRGQNMGSWEMGFDPLRWIDPLALWHGERTTLGFADGHSESHKWHDKNLIDWCHVAMYEPFAFAFRMTPPADEQEDIEYMGAGFPCKSHR